jgi:signal transduction histidine kinase
MRSLRARLGAGLVVSLLAVFMVQWFVVTVAIRHLAEDQIRTRLEHDLDTLLSAIRVTTDGASVLGEAAPAPGLVTGRTSEASRASGSARGPRLRDEVEGPETGTSRSGLRLDPIGEQYLSANYHRPFSGYYYRVAAPKQILRSRSLWDQDLAAPVPAGTAAEVHRVDGPLGQHLLLLVQRAEVMPAASLLHDPRLRPGVELRGVPLVIGIATDLAPVAEDLRGFALRYALVSLAAAVLLLVFLGATIRLGLRPLDRLRTQLQELGRGRRERLDAPAPREIAPLVDELNRLLDVMQARLQRSREALGNLAHAMKTPLTLLGHLADDRRLARSPALRASLTAQTATLHRQIERALARARLAGAAAPGERFDPAVELPALVATLRALYPDKALDIAVELAPQLALDAEREDMLELLGNLLDNACKWCRSKVVVEAVWASTTESPSPRVNEGARERASARSLLPPGEGMGMREQGRSSSRPGEGLRVRAREGWGEGAKRMITITIEDDGPGCPPEELARLAQRGVRLDESAPGHGLGLAIAQDIVAGYGGTLSFDRSELLGGFRATVQLPLRSVDVGPTVSTSG